MASSDHATMPADRREALGQAVAAAIDRRGGTLHMPYVSLAFLVRRR